MRTPARERTRAGGVSVLPGHAPHDLRRARAALRGRDAERVTAGAGVDFIREIQRPGRVEDLEAEGEYRPARQLELLGQPEVHFTEPPADEPQILRAAVA